MTATRAKKKVEKKRGKKSIFRTGGEKTPDAYDALARKHSDRSRTEGRGNFWRPPQGKSFIRLVPFQHKEEGDKTASAELFVRDIRHWLPDKTNCNCPGEGCPICEILEDMADKIGSETKGRMRPQTKILCNAIVWDGSPAQVESQTVIASLPMTVAFGNFKAEQLGLQDFLFGNEELECSPIKTALNAKNGRTFMIHRKGTKLDTNYQVAPLPSASSVTLPANPVDLIERQRKQAKTFEQIEEIAATLPAMIRSSSKARTKGGGRSQRNR